MSWQTMPLAALGIVFLFGAMNLSGVFKWLNNRINNRVAGSSSDLAQLRGEIEKIKIALSIRERR